MLHPVGDLPAGVYWRRRAVVLLVLLALLAGGGWLGWWLLAGRAAEGDSERSTSARAQLRPPALERVVPSMAGVRTPGTSPAQETASAPAAEPAGPVAGGPCTDDVLGLTVRAPATVAVGSKPTLELVVTNASAVPCLRSLDKELQEIVLFDAAGNRVWGSNDCFPEASEDSRTLAPGEEVAFPLVWGGLSSEPTCTAPRVPPPPGAYVLRGRLDTKVSADTPLTLG